MDAKTRAKIELGRKMESFVTDPDISAWFAERRNNLVALMLKAKVLDDDTRRAAALEINVLDQLQNELKLKAAEGERVKKSTERKNDAGL